MSTSFLLLSANKRNNSALKYYVGSDWRSGVFSMLVERRGATFTVTLLINWRNDMYHFLTFCAVMVLRARKIEKFIAAIVS